MAINMNFNLGQNPLGAPGFGGGYGMSPAPQMGGMNPMLAAQSQMMNMLTLSMMTMMTQLMQTLVGGTGLSGAPGQFGGNSGGSPLNGFLGGGNPSGGSSSGASSVAPTGSGANIGPADGSTSPKTKKFIDLALSKQGTPYVFGAAGPNAFDCSGLVSWALKEAGVSGGRATARGLQERYKSTAISNKNDLKPGDLVFFWSKNDRGIPKGQATHVEIYLGNGKTMGTDSPKEGARVEPIDWNSFIGGARVPELNK